MFVTAHAAVRRSSCSTAGDVPVWPAGEGRNTLSRTLAAPGLRNSAQPSMGMTRAAVRPDAESNCFAVRVARSFLCPARPGTDLRHESGSRSVAVRPIGHPR